jgi:phage terminase large subunit-like protein
MGVSLIDACEDPDLFDFPLWPRQRELLQAIDDGPRVHIWALGRRSGKTTLCAVICLYNCLFRPDLDAMVRKGERRFTVAIATNLQQAKILVHSARSIIEGSPLLKKLVVTDADDEISFEVNGRRSVLRALPCSSRGTRGYPISCLVMDEAAHFLSETDGFQTAERVWEAMTPSTAQFGAAGRIVASSTPYGTDGLFADLFSKAQSGEVRGSLAQHATTQEINPTITQEFLDAEQARDPDSFAQEYLAEFTASGSAYLDFKRFEFAAREKLEPKQGTSWVLGLDPAFSSDPFGLALVGRSIGDPRLMVLGDALAIKPQRAVSFEQRRAVEDEVLEQVCQLGQRYGARVVTDQYASKAVTDRISRAGLSVRVNAMTAASKTAIFSELRGRLYDASLELHEHPALAAELRRLRTKFTAGQSAVYNPRIGGSHGDMAQALALAVYEQARYGPGSGDLRMGGQTLTGRLMRELGGDLAEEEAA